MRRSPTANSSGRRGGVSWRLLLQAGVSLGVISLLLWMAARFQVLDSIRQLDPRVFLLAIVVNCGAFLVNSYRWQFLLGHAGVREPLGRLISIYFVGSFCSLFLPTSTGGDAVRVYQVARSSGRLGMTLLATLQERLLGLGAALLVGMVATLYHLPLLPPSLRTWALLLQVVGMAGISLLLYPAAAVRLGSKLWALESFAWLRKLVSNRPWTERAAGLLSRIQAMPALSQKQLAQVVGLACCGVLLGIGAYTVIGKGLDMEVQFSMLCLVVPLVWIVRMMPVSLNGMGIGEGAFVFLLGLFAVPTDKALSLTLLVLALNSTLALMGGMVLAWQVARGNWLRRDAVVEDAEPTLAPVTDQSNLAPLTLSETRHAA